MGVLFMSRAKAGTKLGVWVLGEVQYAGDTVIPNDASRVKMVKNWNFSSSIDLEESSNSDSLGYKENEATLSGADITITVMSDGYSDESGLDGQKKLDDAHEDKELVKVLLVTETTHDNGVFKPKEGALYRVANAFVTEAPDDVDVANLIETAYNLVASGKTTRGKVSS